MSKSSKNSRHARPSGFQDSKRPAPQAAATAPATGWLAKLKPLKGVIVGIAGVGAVLSGLVGYYTTYKTVAARSRSDASLAQGSWSATYWFPRLARLMAS